MSIFLSHEIIAFLAIELVLMVLMALSQFHVITILRHWDFRSTTPQQYLLEKKNYLINTILYFTSICKIILFVFFAQSLNALSSIVPGAMCSAGVVGANSYGNTLFVLKIFIIFGFGVWVLLNRLDLKGEAFPYLRAKYILFSILFMAVLVEGVLEVLYFLNIPLNVPVFCCATVFQAPKLPFGYTQTLLVSLFYAILTTCVVLNLLKHSMSAFLAHVLFLFVAYYAITYFFGLYIYEMPNHKCPYCMLQKEYYYIGYVIWGTLFVGTFLGITPFLMELVTKKPYVKLLNYASVCLVFMALICSFYVVSYYLRTGVFL